MTIFHATVFYRTQSACTSWMVAVEANDHNEALVRVRELFKRRRPRAMKVDRIDVVAGSVIDEQVSEYLVKAA